MTITAYASANAAPIANPDVDAEVDLSAVALPQVKQLYGDGDDSTDPTATFTFQWSIIGEAVPATPAVISSTSAQNPTLTANIWGNVRLFLVATNSVTLITSESDPLQAPDSAFVQVRVLSANAGVQKLAPGERNYWEEQLDWAQAIEDGAGTVAAHTILSHSDVTTATGPDVDAITNGGYAENPPATALHLHKGADIDNATAALSGTVTLEDAGSGKCIQKERLAFTGCCPGSRLSTGFWPGVVVPKSYDGDAGGNFSSMAMIWEAIEAITITDWEVCLGDAGGSTVPTTDYVFSLRAGTKIQLLADGLVSQDTLTFGGPASAHAPEVGGGSSGTFAVAAGEYFGIRCDVAPKQSEGDIPGAMMTATVKAFRQV